MFGCVLRLANPILWREFARCGGVGPALHKSNETFGLSHVGGIRSRVHSNLLNPVMLVQTSTASLFCTSRCRQVWRKYRDEHENERTPSEPVCKCIGRL